MTRHTSAHGWEKIATVEPQYWYDERGFVEYAMVWIVTTSGDVFARSIYVDETVEGVVEHYKARGWTDSKCVFFVDQKVPV